MTVTGIYWNPAKYRHEAWTVNNITGQATLIGILERSLGLRKAEHARLLKWWSYMVWNKYHTERLTGTLSPDTVTSY